LLSRLIAGLRKTPLARFGNDISGNVAIIFAFSLVAITLATGGAIDLGRAYSARQKLYEVATLACQYASRPSVIQTDASNYSGSNGQAAYATKVASFITTSLQSQNFQYSQTTATPFTSTQNGPANVSLTANVPTTFMQIAQIANVSISASVHCFDAPSDINQVVNTPYLVQETFSNPPASCAATWCYIKANGTIGTTATPSSSMPSSPSFTGSNGVNWFTTGFCLEIDAVGVINSTDPVGTHSAELNCDNGSGTAGDSAITAQIYLPSGNYELRYFYRSRVDYPDYDPAYICGSTAADVSWANDTNSSGGPTPNALRNNQLGVYLDQVSGSSPPLHWTTDHSEQLAGSNLIDVCVHSYNWIERSVSIDVSTPAYYWLTFSADGLSNSYGGQLANIRLCQGPCSGAPQDNFPTAWPASTNLFTDQFASPTYTYSTSGSSAYVSTSGNMNNSFGTSGAGSGWPTLAASGWATAPYNQIDYVMKSPAQGTQAIEVAGVKSGSMTTSNRLISRGFLLDPGYYQVSYSYISDGQFSSLSGVYCGSTPSAANVASLSGTGTAKSRPTGVSATVNLNSNMVGVFMSHALEASTPVGGGAFQSTTSYSNPSGTTTTTPTVAPNGVSLTSYNPAQVNPLLDICGYAATWQARTVNIQIVKPAYYWLTASALGTPTANYGGAIDNVQLIALGSPYMSSPPSSYVTIPVPDPQPSGSVSFTGFSIAADPLTPPVATQ
jgi:Flp pilus assembly protein TadG